MSDVPVLLRKSDLERLKIPSSNYFLKFSSSVKFDETYVVGADLIGKEAGKLVFKINNMGTAQLRHRNGTDLTLALSGYNYRWIVYHTMLDPIYIRLIETQDRVFNLNSLSRAKLEKVEKHYSVFVLAQSSSPQDFNRLNFRYSETKVRFLGKNLNKKGETIFSFSHYNPAKILVQRADYKLNLSDYGKTWLLF